MFLISSRFLCLFPKHYRLRPSCYIPSLFIIAGAISLATPVHAQEYINRQGTKIAVAPESVVQVAQYVEDDRVNASDNVLQAQGNASQKRRATTSKMAVAQPRPPETDKPAALVIENATLFISDLPETAAQIQNQEKIPGLAAAKMPPAPVGADLQNPPVYVSGEFLDGYADSKVVVHGKGQLIRDESVLQGEELTYNRVSEVAIAENNVQLNKEGDIFLGDYAQLHIPTSRGYVNQVDYWIAETGAQGKSEQVEFLDKDRMVLFKANYTLCEPKANGKYDWNLTANNIELDYEKDEGIAKGAVLRFMDVPILAAPRMSFPLSDKRRSGLLVPTFKIDSDNGFTYMQPYYWNIAPNYDATISPLYMSKRGVGLQGEFRYLHSNDVGQLRGFYLPNDRNYDRRSYGWLKNYQQSDNPSAISSTWLKSSGRGSDRWAYSWQHDHMVFSGVPVLGRMDVKFDLNRVSDAKYWEDFPKMSNSLTSRLLNNEGSWRTYNNGFSTLFRVQRWQTLQSEDAYSTPPFDRTQMRLTYEKENINGFDLHFLGDHTRFKADRESSYLNYLSQNNPEQYLETLSYQSKQSFLDNINNSDVDSKRSVFHATASYPIRHPGWFIVPKVQVVSRHYSFDSPVKNMNDQKAVDELSQYYTLSDQYKLANIKTMTSRSLTIPTLSLDAGLVFERNASLFGKDYIQTLEPRIMYIYTPYRDQSMLPIYDSGAYGYNFASIYTENLYSGYDRIADASMVIAGVGTRLQNANTGAEVLSLNIAQRYRLKEQRVTLNNNPIAQHQGDWLFGVGSELLRNWRFDALVQYNPNQSRTERSIVRVRWKPGPYRVVNFGYRMIRDAEMYNTTIDGAEQLDFSWQWPLGSPWTGSNLPQVNSNGGRWYSVGRLNYSLRDKKIIDGVFGLEYQSCCWVARGVLERKSTGRTKATTGFLFQLEFAGLSRIGMDPLKTLKDSIDRYEVISSERIVRQREFYLYE